MLVGERAALALARELNDVVRTRPVYVYSAVEVAGASSWFTLDWRARLLIASPSRARGVAGDLERLYRGAIAHSNLHYVLYPILARARETVAPVARFLGESGLRLDWGGVELAVAAASDALNHILALQRRLDYRADILWLQYALSGEVSNPLLAMLHGAAPRGLAAALARLDLARHAGMVESGYTVAVTASLAEYWPTLRDAMREAADKPGPRGVEAGLARLAGTPLEPLAPYAALYVVAAAYAGALARGGLDRSTLASALIDRLRLPRMSPGTARSLMEAARVQARDGERYYYLGREKLLAVAEGLIEAALAAPGESGAEAVEVRVPARPRVRPQPFYRSPRGRLDPRSLILGDWTRWVVEEEYERPSTRRAASRRARRGRGAPRHATIVLDDSGSTVKTRVPALAPVAGEVKVIDVERAIAISLLSSMERLGGSAALVDLILFSSTTRHHRMGLREAVEFLARGEGLEFGETEPAPALDLMVRVHGDNPADPAMLATDFKLPEEAKTDLALRLASYEHAPILVVVIGDEDPGPLEALNDKPNAATVALNTHADFERLAKALEKLNKYMEKAVGLE